MWQKMKKIKTAKKTTKKNKISKENQKSKLRDEYASRALSQIPRLLTLLDRNEFHKMEKYFREWYKK